MSRITSHARSLAVLAVVGSLVGVALWPRPLEVEVATVSRGPLAVTIDDEGRTRVRNRFTVAAPVAGHVLRIDLEPGDRVAQGEIIARVRPEHSGLLDARTRADATAAVTAAEAAAERARAEEQRAQASLAYARRELTRTQELA